MNLLDRINGAIHNNNNSNPVSSGAAASTNPMYSGRRISSDETGKTVDLTSEDMRLIRKSWNNIKDKQSLGEKIFYLIFTSKPDLKFVFRINTDNPVELLKHPIFLRHAKVFVTFLDNIIQDLAEVDGTESIVHSIRKAGISHCNVRAMSFTAENWLVFKSHICEVICNTERAQGKPYMAWNKLITFIISEMKDAYLYGVRRNTWPGAESSTDSSRTPSDDDDEVKECPKSAAPILVSDPRHPASLRRCPFTRNSLDDPSVCNASSNKQGRTVLPRPRHILQTEKRAANGK